MTRVHVTVSQRGWNVLEQRLLLRVLIPFFLLVVFSFLYVKPFSFFPFDNGLFRHTNSSFGFPAIQSKIPKSDLDKRKQMKEEERIKGSRIAICLVGGARRFELTGPSILKNVLKVLPNSDLFLHSPLDGNSFKLSMLKDSPRIAAVRIFNPQPIPETAEQIRVLTANGSPKGIQGLLQYFNLVEGCFTMIEAHQKLHNFTFKWILRTRVDGYWSAPLSSKSFTSGVYTVPSGSHYGGLNDRLGIGDFNSSRAALSRLSLIPQLDAAGYRSLNSESAFKAQLTIRKIRHRLRPFPFCILSDRRYAFPPTSGGVPVAALSSLGPLSGAKCRPCTAVCLGPCVADIAMGLSREWSWTNWENGTLELCDAQGPWQSDWTKAFDLAVGKYLAGERKRISDMTMKDCVKNFEDMKNKTAIWDSPSPKEICGRGLASAIRA